MGAYDEQDVIDRVWVILRDYGQTAAEQLLTDTEITTIGTRGAEGIYGRIRPREVNADLTANGTSFLALPGGFIDGFSSLLRVESPPDKVPAEVLDPRWWYVGRDGSNVPRLVFVSNVPGNGATVRVTYTVPRLMNANAAQTTVLDADFIPFVDLAASFCADAIAAKYARTSEPSFNADVVNYRSRAQEWRDIAKRLWDRWVQGIGASADAVAGAASAWANWDLTASWGGYRFNHPRWTR